MSASCRPWNCARPGATFQQIADQLGYRSASGAFNAVKAALKATLREPAKELRELELHAPRRHAAAALATRLQPGMRRRSIAALRIMERRARLLGLDAPTRGELSGPDGKPLALDLSGLSERANLTCLRSSMISWLPSQR